MSDFAAFLDRCRVERALWALDARTAGRAPTRDERRLRESYVRRLQALTPAAESGAPSQRETDNNA